MEEIKPSEHKLLVIGMGSPSDLPVVKDAKIGEEALFDYISSKGINVYTNVNGTNVVLTSIHRTTLDALRYAHDMKRLSGNGYPMVGIFYGGLAFALPGVVAAEAPNVPIIGVVPHHDRAAFYSVFSIPDGTPVGLASDMENAVLTAEKMYDASKSGIVNLVLEEETKETEKVTSTLDSFGIKHNLYAIEALNGSKIPGITVTLTHEPFMLQDFDKRVDLGIMGFTKATPQEAVFHEIFPSALTSIRDYNVNNTLLIGRPQNAALYAARILGMTNPDINAKLFEYREKEAKKYPMMPGMMLPGQFK